MFSCASKMGDTGTNLHAMEDSIGRGRRGGSKCGSGQSGAGHRAGQEGAGTLSRAGCGHQVGARSAEEKEGKWRHGPWGGRCV